MSGGTLDAVIIGWLVAGSLLGALTGFFRSAARIVGLVVAFWAAGALRAPVTSLLEGLGLRSWLGSFWLKKGIVPEGLSAIPVDAGFSERLPDLIAQLKIPLEQADWFSSSLLAEIERATATGVATVGAVFANMLSGMVIDAAAFLAIFFVVHFIADMAGRLLQGTIGRLPLVWVGNRLGGAVLGGLQHLVHVVLVVGMFMPVSGLLPGAVGEVLKASRLAPLMGDLFSTALRRFVF